MGDNFKFKGFTLVELMIVVAIIAFLAVIAVPSFFTFLAKAKRSEAYLNLGAIYTAQKSYWAENGRYCEDLKRVGWKPEGYRGGGKKERFCYTYGFSNGSEGQNYFTGNLETSYTHLSMTKADQTKFVAGAVGDIRGNGKFDLITIDQSGNIKIVKDGLK